MQRIKRDAVRDFHQAKWDEPVIFELTAPGERGVVPPGTEAEILAAIGEVALPRALRRNIPPALPEISQNRVLRHYVRLSQETLGADVNLEIGQGTCTVKYSPKINDQLARNEKIMEQHPSQPEETMQGTLEFMHETDLYLREISGMHRISFQAGGGSQAILLMASIARAHFEKKGEARDEIITTIYSHPSDAAAPHVAGYKIIYIHPDSEGYPDLDAFRAALSPRTAAFFVANPEDTGVYNKRILEFTRLAREHGSLCCYDQANANGLLGVTRARDAGFDMCFFNLHKTFSAPHGCGGPAVGAVGVTRELERYLPVPLIDFDGKKYSLNYDLPDSIVKVRSYFGAAQVVLKAYMWIRALGAEGLYGAAKAAVLNNNYMFKKLMELPFVDAPYIPGRQRIEQARYTLEKLLSDTGIGTADVQRRMMDFGAHYWTSHHPYYVAEPMTLEPTDSPSKADIDEYLAILGKVFAEAYETPQIFADAPERSVCHRLDESGMDDPEKWAVTWRAYLKKYKP
ncbi:MAG: aminomethyl-transferring glycine dehydrogenase subunit GcvPB [Oscillospiraceae bacterium]|nr:aminomethyl-transferring glycine dehydrogenase subunit GcvPB [Oscillospiraceae bacterium]